MSAHDASHQRLRRLLSRRAARLAVAIVGGISLGCGVGAPAWRPPDIVLISIDTLRADHLPTYGYPRPTAPRSDALARQSLVFDRAYTVAPHTLPSHASLFTGLYPGRHGVLERGDTLAPSVATLAEMLAARQYRTAAFTNCYFLGPDSRIARGFAHFDHDYGQEMGPRRDAETTNAAVFRWADRLGAEPFFLFVHYFDVHSDWEGLPYDSPDEYRQRFAGEPPASFRSGDGMVSATRYLSLLNTNRTRLGEDDLRYLTGLYDASVAYTDAQMGALLDGLAKRGRLRNAIVILLSDHGEELQDHGKLMHGQLYDEVMRTPLLVSLPEMRGEPGPTCRALPTPAPGRTDALVQHVDMLPTLAECLGERPPEGVQGQSFLAVLGGARGARGAAYFDTSLGYQRGLLRDGWKWIEDPPSGRRQLYHHDGDPRERHDLSKQQPERATALASELAEHRAQNEALRVAGDRLEVPAQVHEALEALGYVNEGVAP